MKMSLTAKERKLANAQRRLRKAESLIRSAAQEMNSADNKFFPQGAAGIDAETAANSVESILRNFPVAMQ